MLIVNCAWAPFSFPLSLIKWMTTLLMSSLGATERLKHEMKTKKRRKKKAVLKIKIKMFSKTTVRKTEIVILQLLHSTTSNKNCLLFCCLNLSVMRMKTKM